MTSEQNTNAKETVLAKIREKSVFMRPKFYFTFETFLAGFVALVILVVSIAILSFIFFSLRVNGHESLLTFGPRGIETFLLLFPWPLLALDVLLVLFLETLVRRFKFGYRSPILYLLLGLVALCAAGGLVLDRETSVNDMLFHDAQQGGLPQPFGDWYDHARGPAPHDHGIYRGTITQLGTSTLTMSHDDLDTDNEPLGYLVMLPPGFDISMLSIGEEIYVAGDAIATSTIRAFGIHMLPPPETALPPHP